MRIETDTMTIVAEVGSLRYWYKAESDPEEYEITGVSADHVEALAMAESASDYSASATVRVLTYLHRNEHFDSAGKLVPPAAGWDRDEATSRSAIDRRGHRRI